MPREFDLDSIAINPRKKHELCPFSEKMEDLMEIFAKELKKEYPSDESVHRSKGAFARLLKKSRWQTPEDILKYESGDKFAQALNKLAASKDGLADCTKAMAKKFWEYVNNSPDEFFESRQENTKPVLANSIITEELSVRIEKKVTEILLKQLLPAIVSLVVGEIEEEVKIIDRIQRQQELEKQAQMQQQIQQHTEESIEQIEKGLENLMQKLAELKASKASKVEPINVNVNPQPTSTEGAQDEEVAKEEVLKEVSATPSSSIEKKKKDKLPKQETPSLLEQIRALDDGDISDVKLIYEQVLKSRVEHVLADAELNLNLLPVFKKILKFSLRNAQSVKDSKSSLFKNFTEEFFSQVKGEKKKVDNVLNTDLQGIVYFLARFELMEYPKEENVSPMEYFFKTAQWILQQVDNPQFNQPKAAEPSQEKKSETSGASWKNLGQTIEKGLSRQSEPNPEALTQNQVIIKVRKKAKISDHPAYTELSPIQIRISERKEEKVFQTSFEHAICTKLSEILGPSFDIKENIFLHLLREDTLTGFAQRIKAKNINDVNKFLANVYEKITGKEISKNIEQVREKGEEYHKRMYRHIKQCVESMIGDILSLRDGDEENKVFLRGQGVDIIEKDLEDLESANNFIISHPLIGALRDLVKQR